MTIWNEVLVLPAESPVGARMVAARPDDGGELRAGTAPSGQGQTVLEIGYSAESVGITVAEGVEEPKARWPTLEEIYSAMDALLEVGAVVTLTLVRGQDREGSLKVLTLTQIGKVVPTIGKDGAQ